MEDHTEIINELWEIIKEKEESKDDNSYTYKTLEKGIKRASQKVGEEASELIIASLAETKKEIINCLLFVKSTILVALIFEMFYNHQTYIE